MTPARITPPRDIVPCPARNQPNGIINSLGIGGNTFSKNMANAIHWYPISSIIHNSRVQIAESIYT
jgi:hypothetical protein